MGREKSILSLDDVTVRLLSCGMYKYSSLEVLSPLAVGRLACLARAPLACYRRDARTPPKDDETDGV